MIETIGGPMPDDVPFAPVDPVRDGPAPGAADTTPPVAAAVPGPGRGIIQAQIRAHILARLRLVRRR